MFFQRPSSVRFVFLSLEDETRIARVILTPDMVDRDRSTVARRPFQLIEGTLQNQDGVLHVKAKRLAPLNITTAVVSSHDFH